MDIPVLSHIVLIPEIGMKTMKHKLLAGLLSCYMYEGMKSNKFFAAASALYPQYKLQCFSSASKAAAVSQMLLDEIKKIQPSHKHSESEPLAKTLRVQSKFSLLACVEEMQNIQVIQKMNLAHLRYSPQHT